MVLRLSSSAFADHGEIPARFTCEGQDVSPPLAWSGAPGQTKGFVLIVDDPDAPDPRAPAFAIGFRARGARFIGLNRRLVSRATM